MTIVRNYNSKLKSRRVRRPLRNDNVRSKTFKKSRKYWIKSSRLTKRTPQVMKNERKLSVINLLHKAKLLKPKKRHGLPLGLPRPVKPNKFHLMISLQEISSSWFSLSLHRKLCRMKTFSSTKSCIMDSLTLNKPIISSKDSNRCKKTLSERICRIKQIQSAYWKKVCKSLPQLIMLSPPHVSKMSGWRGRYNKRRRRSRRHRRWGMRVNSRKYTRRHSKRLSEMICHRSRLLILRHQYLSKISKKHQQFNSKP